MFFICTFSVTRDFLVVLFCFLLFSFTATSQCSGCFNINTGLTCRMCPYNLAVSYTSSDFSPAGQTSSSRPKNVALMYGKRLNLLLYPFSIKHNFLWKICLKPLSPSLKYISESNKIFHYTSKVVITFYFCEYQNFLSLEGCLLCITANLINEVQWIQLMSHHHSRVIMKRGKSVFTEKGFYVLRILGKLLQKSRQSVLLLYVNMMVRHILQSRQKKPCDGWQDYIQK